MSAQKMLPLPLLRPYLAEDFSILIRPSMPQLVLTRDGKLHRLH